MTWRTFEIMHRGFDPFVLSAPTRSKARWEAYRRYREHFDATFMEFLGRVHVRACPVPASDGYRYVREQYGVDFKVDSRVRLINEGRSSGQEGVVIYPGPSTAHYHVVIDGRDFPVKVHPMSLEAAA